jgi:DNA polymerase-3 subunit gamma/tau
MAFAPALDELASLLYRIAVAQAVEGSQASMEDGARIADYASALSPETVQLAYQICVQGREDLALAPDEGTGFAMTLLRLLAFEPGGREAAPADDATARSRTPAQGQERPRLAAASPTVTVARDSVAASPSPTVTRARDSVSASASPSVPPRPLPDEPAEWPKFIASLDLTGIAGQLAAQTELIRVEGREVTLGLPEAQRHLTDKTYVEKLRMALEEASGAKLRLVFELRSSVDVSLAAQDSRERAEQRAQAEAAFRDEPFVRDVLARFDARIKPDSIKPAR